MNSTETAQLLAIFRAAYENEVTDDMAMLWDNAFAQDEAHAVLGAARDWVLNETQWPTVAGIRQKMRELRAAQARDLSWTSRRDPQEHTVSFADGQAIAAVAYDEECTRQGREPNWAYFNFAIGITSKAEARRA